MTPNPTRRLFLTSSLAASGGLLAGCAVAPEGDDDDSSPLDLPGCDAAYEAGVYLETLPFENDGTDDDALETRDGEGHDARLMTDLRALDEDALVTANADFYIRTGVPDQLPSTDDWTIRIRGLVDADHDLPLADLLDDEQDFGEVLLECSGNSSNRNMGLMASCRWSGILMTDVLKRLSPTAAATRVLVSGFDEHSHVSTHSTPGASWIFTFDELAEYGAFLATGMNDAPLPDDHGFPVRLVVPRWYGCACIKWVDEVRLVDEDEPATSQMQEFAVRTHQAGIPALARDFLPASMDVAAMPTRIEKWELDGEIAYRVIGIVWGGEELAPAISVQFGDGAWQEVTYCPERASIDTWGLWWTTWMPTEVGEYAINCRADDPNVRTRRLDVQRYERVVIADEVGPV